MSEATNSRIGEVRIMSNGMKAEIIEYRRSKDIDIKFEDGTVKKHVQYYDFSSGKVSPDGTRAVKNSAMLELRARRIGETCVMSNGMKAEIIEYRRNDDIDIKFEDGTVKKRVRYSHFLSGKVSPDGTHAVKNSAILELQARRIGETRVMSNGMKAEIIEYRSSIDMDIQFEDGTVRKHARYPDFQRGKVSPIYIADRIQQAATDRIGETRMMCCGHLCTIIDYRGAHDITVRFENGTILTQKYYSDFTHGAIRCPVTDDELKNDENADTLISFNRLGETKLMCNGLRATVIEYKSSSDIDVQFEDGAIRRGVKYETFFTGRVRHPDAFSNEFSIARIGETQCMKNGRKASIIAYRNTADIDVEFDDGVVVKNQRYEKFKKGEIPHPDIKYKSNVSLQEFAIRYYLRELGFKKIKPGEWQTRGFGRLELDFYHEEAKIAIEFDGGVHNKPGNRERDIRKNQKCQKLGIKLYRLRDAQCEPLNDANSIDYVLDRQKQVIVGYVDCKQEIEAILQKHNIAFDAEYIDFIRDYDAILNEYNNKYVNYYAKFRVGEKSYNSTTGQNMEIIKYNSSSDIDVRFDDGNIRCGVSYSDFKRGTIRHPDRLSSTLARKRLGERKTMSNGMSAQIVAYRKCEDIDVQFDDGEMRTGVDYDDFKKGHIKHPSKMRNRVAASAIENSSAAIA